MVSDERAAELYGATMDQVLLDEFRRQMRLERYQRYNESEKGQQRRKRYEKKHPDRKKEWSNLMKAKARDRR
jgi:hypothetical protein